MGPDILHEINHSIDPNEMKRQPTDRMLEEFGAYYQEIYQPRIYISTVVHTDEYGNKSTPEVTTKEVYETVPKICQTLKSDLYVGKYAINFPSVEEYALRVDEIGRVLQQLAEYMSHHDIHKAILNAQSLQELNHLLDTVKREKD